MNVLELKVIRHLGGSRRQFAHPTVMCCLYPGRATDRKDPPKRAFDLHDHTRWPGQWSAETSSPDKRRNLFLNVFQTFLNNHDPCGVSALNLALPCRVCATPVDARFLSARARSALCRHTTKRGSSLCLPRMPSPSILRWSYVFSLWGLRSGCALSLQRRTPSSERSVAQKRRRQPQARPRSTALAGSAFHRPNL
jgi:hypothetical protein